MRPSVETNGNGGGVWPKKITKERRRSTFRAGYVDTLRLLRGELFRLAAHSVGIQIQLPVTDIRADGFPRADARPSFPGVIVHYSVGKVPYSFPCDTFVEWQDNLRAIAMTLERLRAIDRYGVTAGGQQFAGFKALPAGAGTAGGQAMSVEAAARLLVLWSKSLSSEKDMLVSAEAFRGAYRAAAAVLHPDRAPTRGDEWSRLAEAKSVLDAHHGARAGLNRV